MRGAAPDAEGPRDRAAASSGAAATDDFLLLTEPELGEAVRAHLTRMRIASKCEIEPEEHTLGDRPRRGRRDPDARLRRARRSRCSTPADAEPADDELERLRILARTPRWGREIDEGILPAEAGLDERAVSFTKGCFPGQEPVARLHNRGHANRTLRVLEVEGDRAAAAPRFGCGDDVVGRVTSSVPGLALAYVRAEVPDGAELTVAGRPARIH